MTKRTCLSCGFYQPSGSDGMGWCNNPRRKIASDIKLYVREAELPCRDSWDHDLWEDKIGFKAAADVVLNSTARPLAPASVDDIAFITLNQRTSSDDVVSSTPPGSAVDRVLREDAVVSTDSTNSANPAQTNLNPGSVRRAHQRMIAGKRPERFADGGLPMLDGAFTPPSVAKSLPGPATPERVYEAGGARNEEYAPKLPIFGAVPPVQLSEMDRSIPKVAIYPADDERFSEVPDVVDGLAIPLASRPDRPGVKRASFTPGDAAAAPLDEKLRVSPPAGQQDRAGAWQSSAAIRQPAPQEAGWLADASLERDDVVAEAEIDEFFVQEPSSLARSVRKRGGGIFRVRRRETVEQPFRMDDIDDAEDIEDSWDGGRSSTGVNRAPEVRPVAPAALAPAYDDRPVVDPIETYQEFAEVAVVLETALWTDVPRMCRSCRDFRPAESGDRGWCTNKWAFSHRRMVDAEECPCDSSVGCWWLPHDDVWLTASDISAHGQRTPLLDQWLGQLQTFGSGLESGPIQKRQRG